MERYSVPEARPVFRASGVSIMLRQDCLLYTSEGRQIYIAYRVHLSDITDVSEDEILTNLVNLALKADEMDNMMVEAYWLMGKRIVEEEQQGKERADYRCV